jgi:hypothetical protein
MSQGAVRMDFLGRRAEPARPRRKRVVLADRRRPQRIVRAIAELEEQNSVGEVLVRQLMAAQLRSALLLGGILGVVLFGLPVLFWTVPQVGELVVAGIRLPWLVLGVLVYPFLVLLGYFCVRAAERNEREFLQNVGR